MNTNDMVLYCATCHNISLSYLYLTRGSAIAETARRACQ